ncbi:MAG: hypothetical protein HW421_1061 [Ignavibacteria bacterium]|nr:hypothetical protein [Ignavibacteria bacterium]
MKKKSNIDDDVMLPEYDFSGGTRSKYAGRLAEENGYIKIDPVVAKYFKKSEDINKFLIAFIDSIPLKSQSSL